MATAAASNAKFRENLTCPVCLDIFNNDERIPKCMPCGHTCCLCCLLQMVKKNTKNLKCPMCQAKNSVPARGIQDLPHSIALMNMLDLLPDSNNNFDQTDRKKGARPLCRQHAYKECIFLCTECEVGLCNTCMTTMKQSPHYGHMESVDELDVAMKEIASNAEAQSRKLKEVFSNGNTAKQIETDALKWKTSMKQEVSKRVKIVTDGVKKWQRNANKEIDTISTDFENLEEKKEELGRKLAQVPDKCAEYDISLPKVVTSLTGEVEKMKNIADRRQTDKVCESRLSPMIPGYYGSLKQDTATLVLVINDVNSFCSKKETALFNSQHWYVHGLAWKIKADIRFSEQQVKTLAVFLVCDATFNEGNVLSVETEIEVRIISHDPKKKSCSKSCIGSHDQKGWAWGYPNMIAWDRLVDPAEGFVKDNSVTIKVKFTAKQLRYK